MVKKLFFIIVIGSAFVAVWGLLPEMTQAHASGGHDGRIENVDGAAVGHVRSIMPTSVQMVEKATAVLARGWGKLSPAEKEVFTLIFDPGQTGEIDQAFVARACQNYGKIAAGLAETIDVEYAGDSEYCLDQRLFYVDLSTLHVCPQLLVENRELRKARTIIHEVAHWSLAALDRPYFGPASKEYAKLKPWGNWTARLPLVGPLLREFFREDTLFHPDAYAHFAVAVSGQPGALELYLGDDAQDSTGSFAEPGREAGSAQSFGPNWVKRH